MPPIFGMVLKRSEMRDLIAFMKMLRPRERNQDNDEGEGTARAVHGE